MATFERSSPSTLAIKADQPEYYRSEDQSTELLKRLQARRDLCDVVLIGGEYGKRISAHRLILMAANDYFADLLSEPKSESNVWELTLKDVDGDALETLVNFCYTGSLELRLDTIKNLLITANYLRLKEITEACTEFFLRHQQPSNYLAVLFFVEKLNLEALLNNVKKVIYAHFEKVIEKFYSDKVFPIYSAFTGMDLVTVICLNCLLLQVSQHPEFLLLNAKHMSEFIASDDLDVPSEEFVFHVLMKWIEYDPENRRKHFAELLAHVRLPILPTAFLTKEVEPLCTTMESKILILEALKSHLLRTSNFTQPRNPSSKRVENQPSKPSSEMVAKHLLAICAQKTTPANENLAIAGYNLFTKVWTIWDTPIEFRTGFAVTMLGEDLIVLGGSSKESPINTVTKLNIHTMVSSEMTPMRMSRTDHAVAVMNGAIYAIGGYDGRQELNSVERYDPVNQTWHLIPAMDNVRRKPAAAVINNRLYVSGGQSSGNDLNSVECYDPVENTWRFTAPMEERRYSHCLAAHKGYLFAVGGEKCIWPNGGQTERYDPRTDTWTTISYSKNYGYTRCASLGSQLFIYCKNSEFYTLTSKSSLDKLTLQTIHKPSDTMISFECKEVLAIPFEFSPPGSSIRNKSF